MDVGAMSPRWCMEGPRRPRLTMHSVGLGEEPGFAHRQTPDRKNTPASSQSEMLNRGMFFDDIDRSADHNSSPAEE